MSTATYGKCNLQFRVRVIMGDALMHIAYQGEDENDAHHAAEQFANRGYEARVEFLDTMNDWMVW